MRDEFKEHLPAVASGNKNLAFEEGWAIFFKRKRKKQKNQSPWSILVPKKSQFSQSPYRDNDIDNILPLFKVMRFECDIHQSANI